MATLQRKLVHKQFNSPIGLYSDNNVKATLDRELKQLSNGTMGIDFDDSSKPTNLANSAVLRMLEEEENQKRHGHQSVQDTSLKCEHVSRPRVRDVDRETVLKINRRLSRPRRNINWPPSPTSTKQMSLSTELSHNYESKSIHKKIGLDLPNQKAISCDNLLTKSDDLAKKASRNSSLPPRLSIDVDRDTVLKINRRLGRKKCKITWPPTENIGATKVEYKLENRKAISCENISKCSKNNLQNLSLSPTSSRNHFLDVDRDTVLKINRRLGRTKCKITWPPSADIEATKVEYKLENRKANSCENLSPNKRQPSLWSELSLKSENIHKKMSLDLPNQKAISCDNLLTKSDDLAKKASRNSSLPPRLSIDVDRDTVLKINRRLGRKKCKITWPPSENIEIIKSEVEFKLENRKASSCENLSQCNRNNLRNLSLSPSSSRNHFLDVDRETVLKINRRLSRPKRKICWPPSLSNESVDKTTSFDNNRQAVSCENLLSLREGQCGGNKTTINNINSIKSNKRSSRNLSLSPTIPPRRHPSVPTFTNYNNKTNKNHINANNGPKTIKPFFDERKITNISWSDGNSPSLNRSKSFDDDTISTTTNKIICQKNENLHFIEIASGMGSWDTVEKFTRCSSYNELRPPLKLKHIYSNQRTKENVKIMKKWNSEKNLSLCEQNKDIKKSQHFYGRKENLNKSVPPLLPEISSTIRPLVLLPQYFDRQKSLNDTNSSLKNDIGKNDFIDNNNNDLSFARKNINDDDFDLTVATTTIDKNESENCRNSKVQNSKADGKCSINSTHNIIVTSKDTNKLKENVLHTTTTTHHDVNDDRNAAAGADADDDNDNDIKDKEDHSNINDASAIITCSVQNTNTKYYAELNTDYAKSLSENVIESHNVINKHDKLIQKENRTTTNNTKSKENMENDNFHEIIKGAFADGFLSNLNSSTNNNNTMSLRPTIDELSNFKSNRSDNKNNNNKKTMLTKGNNISMAKVNNTSTNDPMLNKNESKYSIQSSTFKTNNKFNENEFNKNNYNRFGHKIENRSKSSSPNKEIPTSYGSASSLRKSERHADAMQRKYSFNANSNRRYLIIDSNNMVNDCIQLSDEEGGLKRVAWPPEPEYTPAARVVPQPQPHHQQSPARAEPQYSHQSQSHYPNQSNVHQRSQEAQSIERETNNYNQQQSHYQQPQQPQQQTFIQQQRPHQQSFSPQAQRPQPSYPNSSPQQEVPTYQRQQKEASHPEPIYQRQHSVNRQSRQTPARTFPNPDPTFIDFQNTPSYLRPQSQARGISPSTVAFSGGVAVQPTQQQHRPQYQQQIAPPHTADYRNASPQPNQYPQHQSHSPQQQQHYPLSNPLSPDSNRSSSILGWSHVNSPTPTHPGYAPQNYQQQQQQQHQQHRIESSSYQNQYQPQATQAFQPVSNNNEQYQQPQYQQQPPQQPQYQQPQYQEQTQYQQPSPPIQQQYQSQQQSQPQQHHQTATEQNYQAQQPFYRQPSPGVITLRREAPVSQQPAPVFASEPAAASFGGGTNMRGDQKWPPQENKQQSDIDNENRRKLALGPVFRPRRVQKDYTQFFNQHALNATYPGYRAPPGTQHYPAH